eukprot:766758-Hanusia_phi.AAC.5
MRMLQSRSWLSLPMVLRKRTWRRKKTEDQSQGISAMSQDNVLISARKLRSPTTVTESIWETKKRL